MSHTRFKLGFVRHKKVYRLSDAAFRLWVSAMDHAREQLTDGALTDEDLDVVPHCPKRGPKRTKLVGELVAAGLWESYGTGWQVHDYLDWQDSANQVRTKLEQARERMRLVRANEVRTSKERSHEVALTDPSPTPDLESGSETGSGSDAGARGPTKCPLDLEVRAIKVGLIREMSEWAQEPETVILDCVREFVSYRTIGKGAKTLRMNWLLELREHIRRAKHNARLKAPGAADHAARTGHRGGPADAPIAPSPMLAMMPEGVR